MPNSLPTALASHTCRHCGNTFPTTTEHWSVRRDGTINLDGWCRTCSREYSRRYRTPRTGTRKFGIEIEFAGTSREAVAQEMRSRGLDVSIEGYNHYVRSGWKLVSDCSCGYELVSPPLKGADGFDQVRKACDALQAAGARINVHCGLHVHHDVADLDLDGLRRAVRTYHSSQLAINGLVAQSRRTTVTDTRHGTTGNRWCLPLTNIELAHIDRLTHRQTVSSLARADRYRTLNLTSLPKYGTLEIRQHQGTLNAKKIIAWIEFGQAIFAAAKAGHEANAIDTDALVDTLVARGKLKAATATYLKARAAQFRSAPLARNPFGRAAA